MFTVEVSLSYDQADSELQTSGFSTGFANGHYSASPSASVGVPVQFELVCHDQKKTMLMVPPTTFSLFFIEVED